jgi:peptide/nickel transport system substrate-binding protein
MKCRILTLLFIGAVLGGCGRAEQTPSRTGSPSGPPAAGDWAIVRYDSEPDSLNPINSTTTNATYVEYGVNFSNVFETLLQYDPENKWSFTNPLLAETYPEISQDHLTYTFAVKDGIRWHDGKPLTPEDFVFSAKAAVCPGVDDAAVRSTISDLVNAEILDGRKIRFTVRKPYFLNDVQLGSIPVVPKHVYDPEGLLDKVTFKDLLTPNTAAAPNIRKFADQFNKHPNNRQPIGTGPYKFERWETGKEITLVRNEDYWGRKPYLDKIVIRIIQDATAALTALKASEVDFQPRLTAIQWAQQTSGSAFESKFAKTKYRYPSYSYIGWNQEKPVFKDKLVRQALTMLLNRQQIVDSLRFGLGTIATTHFTPDAADYDPNIKPWPYDPKRAIELLNEAGWTDHDGDGLIDKDGTPFRFELLAPSTNVFADQLLPVVKEQFRRAGIEVLERRLEFTVLVENLKDHRFDAASLAWTSDLQTDPYQLWHSSSALNRGSNYISFKNPEADRLLEQARTEFDPEKRKQLYWRFQEILHDEQPYTFLLYPVEAAVYDRRFQNVVWMPARPSYDLTAWFVPKLVQKYTVTNPQ